MTLKWGLKVTQLVIESGRAYDSTDCVWFPIRSPSYICAKFEADISIRSKVVRGVPKFRNWVT